MNKRFIAGAVVAVVLVVGAGLFASKGDVKNERFMTQKVETEKQNMAEAESMKKDEGMQKEDLMMKDDGKAVTDESMKKEEMMKVGSYEAYSPEKIARAESGDVVIFFHASWCPSCRGLNADIEANLNAIPEGVSILKADYDKENELKKKYGVTYQHTLVQVDKNGAMIKKWSGSPNLTSLLSQVQ